MKNITLSLTYPQGLHARPSTALFHLLKNFKCKIWLIHKGERVEATNVLGVLSCGVQPGKVEFEAEGQDAEEALRSVERFVYKLNTEHHW